MKRKGKFGLNNLLKGLSQTIGMKGKKGRRVSSLFVLKRGGRTRRG